MAMTVVEFVPTQQRCIILHLQAVGLSHLCQIFWLGFFICQIILLVLCHCLLERSLGAFYLILEIALLYTILYNSAHPHSSEDSHNQGCSNRGQIEMKPKKGTKARSQNGPKNDS